MNTAQSSEAPVGRGRGKLLLLALIFFLPIALAWLIYFGPLEWRPAGRTHHGELISPAQPLDIRALADGGEGSNPLLGKWTLLQVVDGDCNRPCEERIVAMRQLRKSLHRRRTRVQRVLLVSDATEAARLRERLAEQHPFLKVHVIDPNVHAGLRASINREEPLSVGLVDPLGNYLMRYTPAVGLRGMYEDIKRLLKLSNIG